MGAQATTGIIGQYYDRIAANYFADGSGNDRLACYDESGGNPNAILAETGSSATLASFGWKSVTEFALTTVNLWICLQVDNADADCYFKASVNRVAKSQAYGAFSTGGFTPGSGSGRNMKIGHT